MEDAGFAVVLTYEALEELSMLLGCVIEDMIEDSCDDDTAPPEQADILARAAVLKRAEYAIDSVLDTIDSGG